jgi:deoxyribodipyrimidine photo-lyase
VAAPVTLVWFRLDLRLEDNPALTAAAERGTVVPVFIWAPEEEGDWPPGAASRWWLHQSLRSLESELREQGSRLILRRDPTSAALADLAHATGATAVYWNRRYEPAVIARDTAVKAGLRSSGVEAESFNGSLLFEPWDVRNKQGRPFQVYTPFWRAYNALPPPSRPTPAPPRLAAPNAWPESLPLSELALEPKIDWAAGMRTAWNPGSKGAANSLERFLGDAVTRYLEDRNRPDLAGSSSLSPHLHFGEISPRAVWHAVQDRVAADPSDPGAETYRKELVWREFAYHLLYHYPHTPESPLRADFAAFPWGEDPAALRAWQRGRTGYPLVDAGMRQLWTTGWMHNRVRMVVASFLVKHLLLSWQQGARWFWDTLLDADLASNTLGWQWTAGCGADAAPYFRIFNPVSQGEKFDPAGEYVRRWVPELARLPDRWVHKPWEAPTEVLRTAGVTLGASYPLPLVEHADGRKRALDAFATLPRRGQDKE